MPRLPGRSSWGLAAAAFLALAGCRTYEPAPLDPDAILETVRTRRRIDAAAGRVDLARAVELARERSPALWPVREAEATARTLADMPTPLPNPSLTVGPILLSGSDITSSGRWGVEAAAGWLLDVTGNRSAATELRAAQGEAVRIERVARERATYLALRRAFTRHAAATRRRVTLEESESGARSSVDVARRLVEAARATALDVRELEIEVHRAQADVLEARESEDEVRADLAELTGVEAAAFGEVETPSLPGAAPTREELLEAMIDGHPELDAIRARYQVAEARVRAEIAAQFPGVEIGPGYEYEDDVDKYTLGLGFELPIFDRNELGIEAAEGRRREVRAQFEAAVAQRIAAIDAALARLEHRRERLRLLVEQAEPAAREGLSLAAAALRSGALDGLRYLTVARTERSVRLDVVAAEQDVLEAWCDLEQACGAPLLQFASTAVETEPSAETEPTEGTER